MTRATTTSMLIQQNKEKKIFEIHHVFIQVTPKKCIVFSCTAHYYTHCIKNIKSYHQLPKKHTARSLWRNQCRRNDLQGRDKILFNSYFNYYVFPRHFREFQYYSIRGRKVVICTRLLPGAAPSINLRKQRYIHTCAIYFISSQIFYNIFIHLF